jgi:hypothetical protein
LDIQKLIKLCAENDAINNYGCPIFLQYTKIKLLELCCDLLARLFSNNAPDQHGGRNRAEIMVTLWTGTVQRQVKRVLSSFHNKILKHHFSLLIWKVTLVFKLGYMTVSNFSGTSGC